METLSAGDRDCLPPVLDGDGAVRTYLDSIGEGGFQEVMDCMSPDVRMKVHTLLSVAPGLTTAELDCLRRGTRVIYEERSSGVSDLNFLLPGLMMSSVGLMAYCTRKRDVMPGNERASSPENAETRRILICLVEMAGGPEEFVRKNVGSGGFLLELDEASRGQGPCAAG